MKKSLLTLFATLFCLSNLHAQDRLIDSVGTKGFRGFKSLERGMFYYTYYFDDNTEKNGNTTLVIPFLTETMVLESKIKLELPAGSEVLSTASNGMMFFFIVGDSKKKTITYITTDRSGKDINKKIIERVSPSQFSEAMMPKGFSIMPENVLVVTPLNDKKSGYQIECFDKKLVSVWKKEYTAEKGSWNITYCDAVMDKLYVVRKETNAGQFKFTLQGIQVNTGDEICKTEYSKDGVNVYPDFVSMGEGDMVKAGGYYYSSNTLSGKPEGIFAAITDPTGNFVEFRKQAFSDLPDSVKNTPAFRFLSEGSLQLRVQDIIQNRGGMGYTIVAETYREATPDEIKGSVGKTKGVTLSDFIFFSYSRERELLEVNITEKEPLTAVVTGKLANENINTVANWLSKKGFFCYRSYTIEREKPVVIYKNYSIDKFKLFVLSIGMDNEKKAMSFDIGALPAPKNNNAKPLKYIAFNADTEKETTDTNPLLSQDVMASKPGFVLLYQYLPPLLTVTQKPITTNQ